MKGKDSSLWGTMRTPVKLLLLVSLLCGCAATQQQLAPEKRVRAYRAPYMRVFQAAVDYCHESGFTLQSADPSVGTITTDYHADDSLSTRLFGDKRPKIDLAIRPMKNEGLVGVAATLVFMEKRTAAFSGNKDQTTGPSFTVEEYYQKVFDGIERKLTERQKK